MEEGVKYLRLEAESGVFAEEDCKFVDHVILSKSQAIICVALDVGARCCVKVGRNSLDAVFDSAISATSGLLGV